MGDLKSKTRFKTADEAKGEMVEILCTLRNGEKETIFFDASELIVLDTIMWKGYYVSNFVLLKILPSNVSSFQIL